MLFPRKSIPCLSAELQQPAQSDDVLHIDSLWLVKARSFGVGFMLRSP